MIYNNELYHSGVKGMKWGVRKQRDTIGKTKNNTTSNKQKNDRRAKIKKYAKIGAATAVAGLAIYGAYKLHKTRKINRAAVANFIDNHAYTYSLKAKYKQYRDFYNPKKQTLVGHKDKVSKGIFGPKLTRIGTVDNFSGAKGISSKQYVIDSSSNYKPLSKEQIKYFNKRYKIMKKQGIL